MSTRLLRWSLLAFACLMLTSCGEPGAGSPSGQDDGIGEDGGAASGGGGTTSAVAPPQMMLADAVATAARAEAVGSCKIDVAPGCSSGSAAVMPRCAKRRGCWPNGAAPVAAPTDGLRTKGVHIPPDMEIRRRYTPDDPMPRLPGLVAAWAMPAAGEPGEVLL